MYLPPIVVAMLLCAGLAGARAAMAADSLPPGVDASISKGLAFLAKRQEPEGSFDGSGPKVAITSLSILSFLSCGDVPDTGRYGLVVRTAVDWLLAHQRSDGYFGDPDRQMFTQAAATLALAEASGVETNPVRRARVYAALVRAAGAIVAAQNAPSSQPAIAGGWHVTRKGSESGLALAGWNILALRAAQEAGVPVPEQTFARAAAFVLQCYDAGEGGFSDRPGGRARVGDTAIGMLAIDRLGAADQNAARLDAAAQYLRGHPVDAKTPFAYHAAWCVAQAMMWRGGQDWSATGRELLERLVKTQQPDGGWPASKTARQLGRVGATAAAIQSLAVPYRLLPLYQR